MSQAQMQYSFHAGELTPSLNARVDIAKYKAGAALMRNFYPDYRGGASTRSGTKYVLKSRGATPRLIPFQQAATGSTNFCLEFGDKYIRFHNQGSPVLEPGVTLSGITAANPGIVSTPVPHTLSTGDWGLITGVTGGGAANINGRYFIIGPTVSGTAFTLTDLYGATLDTSAYGTMTGGQFRRVYTIVSPYAVADLPLLKYAQNTNTLLLTHNNYFPQLLQRLGPTTWILAPLVIGTTILPPTIGAPSSTLAAGNVNYAYVITSVDSGGQESVVSTAAVLANLQDIRSVAGSNLIVWGAQPGAVSYNVYRAQPSYGNPVPAGAAFGFVGNCTGIVFLDSNIAPDFAQSPPTAQNPVQGQSVISYTVTAPGSYTSAPSMNVDAPSPGGQQATGEALLGITSSSTIVNGGNGYAVGQIVILCRVGDPASTPVGALRVLTTVGNAITSATFLPLVFFAAGNNPPTGASSVTDAVANTLLITPDWGVAAIAAISIGSCYNSAPAVTFTSGGATATAVLTTGPSTSNPGVATYFQQRLIIAAPASNPQEFNMSQTGSYFNFNISSPIGASDAIQGALVSSQINNIKSLIPMSTGLVVFTDKAAWLMNGGSIGSPVSPTTIVATQHSYIGSNDMPPIVINYDILYVQAKGAVVRDLTYNFYAQIYTGTDISILSSHLFYNHQIKEWTYAEEPFKVIWSIRDDGVMLSLTYLKEQEIIGWAHHDTLGSFTSVCSVTEPTLTLDNSLQPILGTTFVDAVYIVAQRFINGQTVYYIERMADRFFTTPSFPTPGAGLSWCVDAGLQSTNNSFPKPTRTVILDHLKGQTIVGVADGTPFTATVSSGSIPSISLKGNIITAGLAFLPQLQTLQLDTGEPTTQGKRKKIIAATLRVQETLGLSIGKTFSSLVPMKDLIVGNLNVMSNTVITDLFTGDARTIIDPSWDVPGQYCIQQSNPLPATILGVIPEIVVGDTPPGGK